jgi:putative hydrolase of the HAD superfamily
LRTYKHIFFDLDKTIWDFDANSTETLRELYSEYELTKKGCPSYEAFHDRYNIHNTALWDAYRESMVTKEELSLQRFLLPLAEFGINDEKLAASISDAYVDRLPLKTKLFPGVFELLDYAFSKYKLHIITNGFAEIQYRKLALSGLNRYFDQVITSEESGYKKPDERIFLHALNCAQALPEESMMIGDDIEVDLLPAKALGLGQVYVNFTKKPHEHQLMHEVATLSEIETLL